MNLDRGVCYRALRTRDARFDGRFFVAVRSTRIYCRPICPARLPRLENCEFVACAAAAQEMGFRPCQRCRPETSPGTPAWLGTSATVSRALRLIAEGALDKGSLDALAARLGVGARHLRRLFEKHLGASPLAVAHTRRALFAKQLIDSTDLPMSEIAPASGFSSIRRFNDSILRSYHCAPTELRRRRRRLRDVPDSEIHLRLAYRQPFQWESLLSFLALRAIPGVERVDSGCYRRSIEIGSAEGAVSVQAVPGEDALLARIRLSSPSSLIEVAERLRRIFDLGADPAEIAAHLSHDPELASRARSNPGIRVPGAWDGFELGVRAILGQQISVAGATTLAGRIAEKYGRVLSAAPSSWGTPRLFPRAEVLADADLTTLGLTRARARSIAALAAAVSRGELVLDASRGLEETVRGLRELPGIGPWTAQYVAMRALREPDAFPAGDLVLRKALGNGSPLREAELEKRSSVWRPWRAYAALLLWTIKPPAAVAEEDSR